MLSHLSRQRKQEQKEKNNEDKLRYFNSFVFNNSCSVIKKKTIILSSTYCVENTNLTNFSKRSKMLIVMNRTQGTFSKKNVELN